nr:MAG TPA: hypothetical protein [Caudoviricetes sp.]
MFSYYFGIIGGEILILFLLKNYTLYYTLHYTLY